ncbi:MAG: protein kinase [Prosthecobacter sp.]|nr:protein kinase [Prosthecobacter sp.]
MSIDSSHLRPAGRWQPPSPQEMQAWLPQYRFEALLGCGGMGAVYQAAQIAPERPVAVRVLPVDRPGEANELDSFKQQVLALSELEHPGIVKVLDAGVLEDESSKDGHRLFYLVMEYLDGTDLARLLITLGRLPEPQALTITAHVCDALACAHQHGFVHGDLRPANLLINLSGVVKVAGFGLVRVIDGTQAPADFQADLHAVGVMFYEMLTGEVPRGSFRMPSVLSGTDPRFDAIIAKAMETDPERGYPTVSDLRRDLDAILPTPLIEAGGEALAAVPPSLLLTLDDPGATSPPPARKSKGLLVYSLATVAALTALVVVLAGGGPQEQAVTTPAAVTAEAVPETKPPPAATPVPVIIEKPSPPTAVTATPAAALVFSGHRYQLVLEKLKWVEARKKAKDMGGYLAVITTPQEWEWLRRTLTATATGHKGNVFIGGVKVRREWSWVNGESFDWKFAGGQEVKGKGQALCFHTLRQELSVAPQAGQPMPFLVEWDAAKP